MMKIYYLILPVISLLFGFIFVSNTYAVQDYTYTFDYNSIPSWYKICGDSSSDPALCSDYTYVVFEPDSSCSSSAAFYVSGLSSSVNVLVSACSKSIYPLSSGVSLYLTGGNSGSYTGNVTLTLTDSFGGSCPEPPEPEPCPDPEPCDCDDAFIVGLFKDSFWRVATAIVALIVPILALFLLFRLVHGLMFGKGI